MGSEPTDGVTYPLPWTRHYGVLACREEVAMHLLADKALFLI